MDADEFIKKAHAILDRIDKGLVDLTAAKEEARALVMELEEYLKELGA